MPHPLIHPAPLPTTVGQIAPHQLWVRLTPSQQQQAKQALIALGQQLLADVSSKPVTEEPNDEHSS